MVTEAQTRAKKKWSSENATQVKFDLYSGDQDLIDYMKERASVEGKAAFFRRLISQDMKGRTVKTVSEILANWEAERDSDWYAVDEITADGRTIRLFVGDADTAKRKAADLVTGVNLVDYEGNPCEPGEFGDMPYYRCQLIDGDEAKAYFEACMA